jgi:hypothetical protein
MTYEHLYSEALRIDKAVNLNGFVYYRGYGISKDSIVSLSKDDFYSNVSLEELSVITTHGFEKGTAILLKASYESRLLDLEQQIDYLTKQHSLDNTTPRVKKSIFTRIENLIEQQSYYTTKINNLKT